MPTKTEYKITLFSDAAIIDLPNILRELAQKLDEGTAEHIKTERRTSDNKPVYRYYSDNGSLIAEYEMMQFG